MAGSDERSQQDDADGEGTDSGAEPRQSVAARAGGAAQPDVHLDVPVVKVEEISLEVENLRARVSLQAEVLDLLKLNVGVDAELGRVALQIKGVEAQALLDVRLDNVAGILDRVLTTIDRNPQILEQLTQGLGRAVEEVGEGAGSAVEEIGEGAGGAVEHVGEGAGSAVKEVGAGAGGAVERVGEGAGEAAEKVGAGAGDAARAVGEGAGGAVENVGEGAGETVQQVGRSAHDLVDGTDDAEAGDEEDDADDDYDEEADDDYDEESDEDDGDEDGDGTGDRSADDRKTGQRRGGRGSRGRDDEQEPARR
ncbi:hypothetical protein, partial [Prauserella alba]